MNQRTTYTAIVEYRRPASTHWMTAIKRVPARVEGVYHNVRQEFFGPDRVAQATEAAKELAEFDATCIGDTTYRVVDYAVTVHSTFLPEHLKDTHTEHCCAEHGCKYADEACTVVLGVKPQSHPCETCDFETEEA